MYKQNTSVNEIRVRPAPSPPAPCARFFVAPQDFTKMFLKYILKNNLGRIKFYYPVQRVKLRITNYIIQLKLRMKQYKHLISKNFD